MGQQQKQMNVGENECQSQLPNSQADSVQLEGSPIKTTQGRAPWLTPVIPATQEAEIRGSGFEASWANSSWDPISKKKKNNKPTKQDWREV
jgi:hypothetical protein